MVPRESFLIMTSSFQSWNRTITAEEIIPLLASQLLPRLLVGSSSIRPLSLYLYA